MEEQVRLIKIKQVAGFLYQNEKKADTVVIYAKGGPGLGDKGQNEGWPVARRFGYDLLIPDYIGFCRSDGEFSFRSCIETFYECEDFANGKLQATDAETGITFSVKYKNIILIGSSWGGSMVPFLEKYRKSGINTIGMIKPVTDWTSQGRTKDPEEDTVMTNKQVDLVWTHLYRGYHNSEWPEIFTNKHLPEFNPVDQTAMLAGKQVLVVHGTEDDVVNYKKTVKYYGELKKHKVSSKLKLYKGDHSSAITVKGFRFILNEYSKTK